VRLPVYSTACLCVLAVTLDRPVVITESSRQLDAHSARVTCLSWSHHQDALLATASHDWLSLVPLVCFINAVCIIICV